MVQHGVGIGSSRGMGERVPACCAEVCPRSPFHVVAAYRDGAVVLWDVRGT